MTLTVIFSEEAKRRAYDLVEQAAKAAGGYELADIEIQRALLRAERQNAFAPGDMVESLSPYLRGVWQIVAICEGSCWMRHPHESLETSSCFHLLKNLKRVGE